MFMLTSCGLTCHLAAVMFMCTPVHHDITIEVTVATEVTDLILSTREGHSDLQSA